MLPAVFGDDARFCLGVLAVTAPIFLSDVGWFWLEAMCSSTVVLKHYASGMFMIMN